MTSPYSNLPSKAFWRSAVTERAALDPGDLYTPKFPVHANASIMTAGSCFAQHVGRALRRNGVNVIDGEPLPASIAVPEQEKYGYNVYSARYGNIYTVRQLLQLLREMRGEVQPAEPVWQGQNGRFYDAQRPSVEPDGLDTPEDVLRHRAAHLRAVKRVVEAADVFVFTLGLTEAWMHTESQTVYPTAPGTIAGDFDPDVFSFVNFDMMEVFKDFVEVRRILKGYNKRMRFLLTVSPVPLTATASGGHVEVATCYSKSVLRAVCGLLHQKYADVDYFPSFELITSANNRGVYFESNKRNVSAKGVETAMNLFLSAHGISGKPAAAGKQGVNASATELDDNEVQCEEALLEAFAK